MDIIIDVVWQYGKVSMGTPSVNFSQCVQKTNL